MKTRQINLTCYRDAWCHPRDAPGLVQVLRARRLQKLQPQALLPDLGKDWEVGSVELAIWKPVQKLSRWIRQELALKQRLVSSWLELNSWKWLKEGGFRSLYRENSKFTGVKYLRDGFVYFQVRALNVSKEGAEFVQETGILLQDFSFFCSFLWGKGDLQPDDVTVESLTCVAFIFCCEDHKTSSVLKGRCQMWRQFHSSSGSLHCFNIEYLPYPNSYYQRYSTKQDISKFIDKTYLNIYHFL